MTLQEKKPEAIPSGWMVLLILAVILVASLAASAPAAAGPAVQEGNPTPAAASPITDDMVNVVAKQLYCPVCENVPLDVCPTQACTQWRELIRQMLGEGRSEEYIKNYFVQRYGDRVLAVPPTSNPFNWLFYIIPPIAILAGSVILYRAMRSWRKPVQENQASPPATDLQSDDYVKRVEEELKRM